MTTRTRSRVGALALAGLLALVPVAGPVALAPAAAAHPVVASAAEATEPEPAPVEIAPISAELGDVGAPAEEEVDYLGSLMLFGATTMISLGSIAMVAYFLFIKKPPVRKNAV